MKGHTLTDEERDRLRAELTAIRRERAEQAELLDVLRRWHEGTFLPRPSPRRWVLPS